MAPPSEGRRFQRRLGTYTTGAPGPMVVLQSGIHGNEPAGVAALREARERLLSMWTGLEGELESA